MKSLLIIIVGTLLLALGCGGPKNAPQANPVAAPQQQPDLQPQPIGGPEIQPPQHHEPQQHQPEQPAAEQPAPTTQEPEQPPVEQPPVTPEPVATPEPEPATPAPGSKINMVALNLAKKAIDKVVPVVAEELKKKLGDGTLGTLGATIIKYTPTSVLKHLDKAKPFMNLVTEKMNGFLGDKKLSLSDEEKSLLFAHFLDALKGQF